MFDESVKTAVGMDIVHGHWLLRTITISAHDIENENANIYRLINYPVYFLGICFFHLSFLFSKSSKLGKHPLLKGKINFGLLSLLNNLKGKPWQLDMVFVKPNAPIYSIAFLTYF